MKVKKLIKLLSNCDPEKKVRILFDNGYGEEECDIVRENENEVTISEKLS